MSEAAADESAAPGAGPYPPDPAAADALTGRRIVRPRWLWSAGLVALAGLGGLWLVLERIADRVIAGQLRDLNLPATYRIESIGLTRQVLRDIVVGDPRHPDLVIARAEIVLVPQLGQPRIGAIRLTRPRLYGRWEGNRLSFGTLDPLLTGSGDRAEPFRLPRLDLTVIDGGARLEGDHGTIGLSFEGQGALRDGFAGSLGMVAPRLDLAGCKVERGSLFGRISVAQARPALTGPLRLGALTCPTRAGLAARDVVVDLALRADQGLDGGAGRIGVQTRTASAAGVRANGWDGTIETTYRSQSLTARYNLVGRGLEHGQIASATLSLDGVLRGRGALDRMEAEGTLDAGGLRMGPALARQLASWERGSDGTLLAPLLRQARQALLREERGSRLRADYVLRAAPQGIGLVLPRGEVSGGSGASLLALSRVQLVTGTGPVRLAGNFVTGGAGLPQLHGRLGQGAGGRTRVSLAMADYRAGDARLAIPRLTLVQERSGALAFTGILTASGALPGGRVEGLSLPLTGQRGSRGGFALWPACTPVRFAALSFADLALDRPGLTLCPPAGSAIVQGDGRGLRVAAGTPALALAGRLGATPVRIASGAAGYASTGGLFVSALDIALGPAPTASHFRIADLRARLGADPEGTFAGADVQLAAVPLNLREAGGTWRYAGGRLTIADARFRLEDREQVPRFQPLLAEGGTLALAASRITAEAVLREPKSKGEVARVDLVHDLGTARGHADLRVAGLDFAINGLQPSDLSHELLGVATNVSGRVTGAGRIDWTADRLRSTGRFRTDGLDLAAAFGPTQGIRGEVEFSDLLGLVTPPHQRLTIASLNPGIEVLDGEMLFQLRPGSIVAIEGARWPFLGGTLGLRPTAMGFGVAETRRFVLDIAGLDAARFVERMELANLTANGTFDGTLPLIFDADGGRIEGGLLTARPPGGNLSYVGALTYKDLSPIANFAFDALKSLDYRAMRIAMDGALEGEVVTRVRFDGVKQGAGARRNVLTQRFARLPIQFNVNLRAPFYSLITSVRGLYDPAFVVDPRVQALIDAQRRPVPRPARAQAPVPAIQPPVSEKKP